MNRFNTIYEFKWTTIAKYFPHDALWCFYCVNKLQELLTGSSISTVCDFTAWCPVINEKPLEELDFQEHFSCSDLCPPDLSRQGHLWLFSMEDSRLRGIGSIDSNHCFITRGPAETRRVKGQLRLDCLEKFSRYWRFDHYNIIWITAVADICARG